MEKKDGFVYWQKGEDEYISDHFKCSEFTCHCEFEDCKDQMIEQDLLDRLQWLREAAKSPLEITSGFRCAKYQAKLVADGINTVVAKKSTHEEGKAADVRCGSLIIPELLNLAKLKFHSYGVATNFIHLDTRPPHDDGTPRTWTY